MKNIVSFALAVSAAALAGTALAQRHPEIPVPPVTDEGVITTPSFELPFSSFASREARDAFVKRLRSPTPMSKTVEEGRRLSNAKLMPLYEDIKRRYPTTSTRAMIEGVPVETFTPAEGVAPENRERILVELHGGGFVAGGGGMTGALSAMPIASVGKIKVMSVDYRLAPEHTFPAASEDVEAVYRELLKTYRPENIGFFGCSAGGTLAAQTVAWFRSKDLPQPGALGVLCASLYPILGGDSGQMWGRMGSTLRIVPPMRPDGTFGMRLPYFEGVSSDDPLAVPAASEETLRAFPPTLLLTGTRAPDMSGAVQSHLELRDLGRTSELLLFDGLDHGFFSDASLPESQRAYRMIARFFNEHLGSPPRQAGKP